MRITKSITFDAAHFLDSSDPDEADRPYARMHGHSFLLDVTIEGVPDRDTGWVVDFADLTDEIEKVKESLDHRLLNEVEGLEKPTLENICNWVAQKLRPSFAGLRQVRVSRPSNGETCVLDL